MSDFIGTSITETRVVGTAIIDPSLLGFTAIPVAPHPYVISDIATTGHAPIADKRPVELFDEEGSFTRMGAVERWNYIRRNNPVDFYMAAATITTISFVIAGAGYRILPVISSALVAPAQAAKAAKAAQGAFEQFKSVPLEYFAAILLAVCLLWCYGIISWSPKKDARAWARETAKRLEGIFYGLIAGAGLAGARK